MDAAVFAARRRRLLATLGDGALAIFPAAPERTRSNDVEYRYRQQSDFHYLTGFGEPGAVCVLQPGHPDHEYVLFVRPRDRERETWTGRRAGVEGAMIEYGADKAYPIEELEQHLPRWVGERDRLFCPLDGDEAFAQRALRWVAHGRAGRQRSGSGALGLLDAAEPVHEMRLFKGPEELAAMRRAAAISAEAHVAAMRAARPGGWEYEIEALIEYDFRRRGAAGPAYPSIVASGANATILHYTTNDRQLAADELLLIDAGAEYDFYCADITRTFPTGPRFAGRQRDVYALVLAAQRAAIAAVRPGARFDEPHREAVRVLVEGMLSLGILAGSADEMIEKERYKPLYMHRTSHWLGMDVHDVGLYKRGDGARVLEPGMVLTVEPGLYIADFLEDVAPEWHGIGVRIEDDVLVTPDGCEVLTAAVPKGIAEIEELRAAGT
ncbi:aminopeptidase P N-terminal domain-containing protein [bacterium]|nr:aminopeptidase P N-terminal domain-containing protein [bacterium]